MSESSCYSCTAAELNKVCEDSKGWATVNEVTFQFHFFLLATIECGYKIQ